MVCRNAPGRQDAGNVLLTRSVTSTLLPSPERTQLMPDLADGESTEMKGSGAKPYVLKNTGGVYSCTCPAWRNQNTPIERRTCKHLRKLRGDAAEEARLGGALPQKPLRKASTGV